MAISTVKIDKVEVDELSGDAGITATLEETELGVETANRVFSPFLIRNAINARLAEGIDIDGGQL